MKQYFIGIDSDGTAFDSMTVKHREAFIPEIVRIWGYEDNKNIVFDICERINLYSGTRGIDRFSGLKVTFEELEKTGLDVPDYRNIDGFLNSGLPLSNAGLKTYLQHNTGTFLNDVLEWSIAADDVFKEKVKNLMPFHSVRPALEKAYDRADVAVISSASESSLSADWEKDGLINFVDKVYGQEFGKKTAQLKSAAVGKYRTENMIMIGDALGDYKAAQAVGAWFYPIIPGKEELSWKQFLENVLDVFLSGEFNDLLQKSLLDEFYESLDMEENE